MGDVRTTWMVRVALAALVAGGCGADEPADHPPAPRGDVAPASESLPDEPTPVEPTPVEPTAGEPTRAEPAPATGGKATDGPDADGPAQDGPGASEPGPRAGGPAAPPLPPLGADREAALALAGEASDAGDFDRAIVILREAESEHGEHPQLRLASAWAHFAIAERAFRDGGDKFFVKGYIADAQLRVRETAAMHPDVPGAALLAAKIERYSENPDRAREILQAQVETHPDDVDAHRELGDMAWSARDWYGVDTHYTHVARARPEDGEACFRATFAKHWLGMPAENLEEGYLAAARLLPDDDRPLRQLARLYPGDRARKIALMEKVIEANPRAVWARVWIAYTLRTEGEKDPAAALEVLDAAVAIAPTNAALLYNRAQTLLELGRSLQAVTALVEAIEAGGPGEMTPASDELDRLLHADPVAAEVPVALRERAYDAVCARNPGIGRFGNNAGLWFRDVGKDYEKSLKYYLASVAAEPEDQDYLNDTALIYLFHLRDRKDLALPMFEKVLSLVDEVGLEPKRGYWDTLENLCKYWFEKGRYQKVVDYATRRADPSAVLNGRPYPSAKAAAWKARAEQSLRRAD